MSTDFKVKEDGSLDLRNGDIQLVTKTEQLKQDIQTKLRLLKGEYFLNQNVGIDWITLFRISSSDTALRFIDSTIRSLLTDMKEIDTIANISIDEEKNLKGKHRISISYSLFTSSGRSISDTTTVGIKNVT